MIFVVGSWSYAPKPLNPKSRPYGNPKPHHINTCSKFGWNLAALCNSIASIAFEHLRRLLLTYIR